MLSLAWILACSVGVVDTLKPFDGSSLNGWAGDKSYWSAEGGELVGRTTPEHPLPESTYLIWQGDMPQDFDLRCKVRITGAGGNSGIQYRSAQVQGQKDLAGFQADLDVANAYTGMLYEGLGRSLMSARGEQVEWAPAGKRVLAHFAPDEVLRKAIKNGEWNEYRIQAEGTRVRHWINGVLMTDVTDGDASRFRRDGLMALQLHAGAPMEVRFKDLEVTPIVAAPPPSSITAPADFTVELLASAQPAHGSWACIAFDSRGRAVISPQYGQLLQVWIPGQSKNADGTPWAGMDVEIRPLETPVRSAQGLCFVGDDLYVDVASEGLTNGLWRVRDLDSNGSYEDAVQLVKYDGEGGEHGPHGIVCGPDGALYVSIGNHTRLPASIVQPATDDRVGRAPGSPYDNFAEDFPLPRMWDPRGHAVGIYAPGGVVLRFDPTTQQSTVFAGGFRNAYDLCFDERGELFTYDSDMEWDIGAPWYRAPRVVHVVRGGEYGWRSGSGCWPDWYADSLPPVCETDSSSPTGMLSGHVSAWPIPWRDKLFCADWTYGRVLAIQLREHGATFTGSWQPFLTGRPMPVADMAWGPDGQMYLVTGGRGTQSGLYRIRYTGNPMIGQTLAGNGAGARSSRRSLEAVQHPIPAAELPDALPSLIQGLNSEDRWIQFAARTALELQPIGAWRELVPTMVRARGRVAGALALARVGTADDAVAIVSICTAAIAATPPTQLGAEDALTAVRALQVLMARTPFPREGKAAEAVREAALLAVTKDPVPEGGPLTWAALELACGLGDPSAVKLAMQRMSSATDRSLALRYAAMLRNTTEGWDDDLRMQYWKWLNAADDRAGGFSLRGFIEQIKRDALTHVTKPTGVPDAPPSTPDITPIATAPTSSTLHAWTVDELASANDADGGVRDLERGARIFREATCILCHRVGGEGATTGPDLTGAGGRFSRVDLLRAILEPSALVSDQYRDFAIELKDGDLIVGRIVADTPEYVEVRTNPLTEDREKVRKSDIAQKTVLETSSMPRGLLDARTRTEVLDLLAYLQAGGVK